MNDVLPRGDAPTRIERVADTTADGRGVIRGAGKTVFLDGAIGGETVRFRLRKQGRRYDEAELLELVEPSPDRVEPRCAVFGTCGGCALQHLEAGAQLRLKESILLENLRRLGGVYPARVLPPVSGAPWGYRRRARLAVKYVARKGRVLVGFRERHASYVTDTPRCETLHAAVGTRLAELAGLVQSLSLRERIPQIEVAVGDDAIALVFRVLDPATESDLERLRSFARDSGFAVYLQTGGADSVAPLPGVAVPSALHYTLPEAGLRLEFQPLDFVQVNAAVNRQMLARALTILAPQPRSRVLDLYCGLGNFSLPLAQQAATVTGVEMSAAMVGRAAANAARAGLHNTRFLQADLAAPEALAGLVGDGYDRVLLDPPRSGAAAVLPALATMAPERIVYVSCHPGTLARDAWQLTTECGYRLAAAGVVDMFPQTAHVESIALFVQETADA